MRRDLPDNDTTLKVLMVTNTIAVGGAERQVKIVSEYLNKRSGIIVDVLYYAREQKEYPFDAEHLIFIDKSRMTKLTFILRVRDVIRKGNYQIVHAFGGGSANIYGRVGALLAKTPVIIGAVLGQGYFLNMLSKMIYNTLNLFMNRWTVNNLALKRSTLSRLRHVTSDRIVIIQNGLPPLLCDDLQNDIVTDYDENLRLHPNAFVFCTVGRLERVKNYPLFLHAIWTAREANPDIIGWIIGDGSEREELERLSHSLHLDDAVVFFGMRNDVNTALDRANVYVHTSDREGTPNTVIEAMRVGRPVISTRCTDLTDIVTDDYNGYTVPCNDVNALAERMLHIAGMDRQAIVNMGDHARDRFRQKYDIEKVANCVVAYYRECLSERHT